MANSLSKSQRSIASADAKSDFALAVGNAAFSPLSLQQLGIATQSINVATQVLPTDTLFADQTNLFQANADGGAKANINIAPVWAMGYTGKGISIGVFDTAMDVAHADLKKNVDLSKRVVTNSGSYVDPTKIAAHGDEHATAVAGIIAAARNEVGVVGIAYDAKITPINIFDGRGSNENYIWDSLKKQFTFDITNHSWGFTNAFSVNALDAGWQKALSGFAIGTNSGRGGLGTIENVAAGNYRQAGLSTETNGLTVDRHVNVIGATDQYGDVAYYSNPGASLLVVAPSSGDNSGVVTSDVTGALGYSSGDYTDSFGGTSAATPEISGIAADMLQANPKLGWRDVQSILAITARLTGSEANGTISGYESDAWSFNHAHTWNGGGYHFSNDYGFGLVDAAAAVRMALDWNVAYGAPRISRNEVAVSSTVQGYWNLGQGQTTIIEFFIESHQSIEAVSLNLNDLAFNKANHLMIELTGPNGTTTRLLDFHGGDGSSITGGWQLMSREFLGEDSFGIWSVKIVSSDAEDIGQVSSISLNAYGSSSADASVFVYTDEYATLWSSERSVLSYDAAPATIFASAISGDINLDLQTGRGTINGAAIEIDAQTYVDVVITGDGTNRIVGDDKAISVYGGNGIDAVTGSAGNDRLDGSNGDDLIEGLSGNDTLIGGNGIDTVSFAHAANAVTASLAIASVQKTGAGSDIIKGFENLDGSSFNDTLVGNAFANAIDGGLGDDVLTGGLGADTLTGGSGSDTAVYAASKIAVIIDLSAGTASGGEADGDILAGIENLTGSAYADTLIGDSRNNVLLGGAGADILDGGDGVDTLSYATSSAVTVDLSAGTATGGDAKGDIFAGFESVIGGKGNDILTGDAHDNALNGGNGNDWLDGGVGADQLEGGAGIDTVSYANSGAGVSADLDAGVGTGGTADGDTLVNIENVIGSAFNDTLTGNAGNNTINGGIGDDLIEDLGGNDTLIGGDGIDTVSFARASNAVTVSLAIAFAQKTGAGTDIIAGFENITGSVFHDALTGNEFANIIDGGNGDDILTGGFGADTLIGGNGSDTAAYAASKLAVSIDLAAGTVSGGDADGDILISIESLTGSAYTDTLIGDSRDNVLLGGAGADILDGGAGIDTVSYATSSAVTINLATGQTAGGHATGDVIANFENIVGSNGNDILTGDGGDNALSGGNGNDLLDGGAGADLLDGGSGIDTVSYAASSASISINLRTGFAAGGDADGDVFLGIENLTGSAFNDTLIGNAGNNVLKGGAGDDVIEGMGGDDSLIGGDGIDVISFAQATSAVTVSLAVTSAQNTGVGRDTITGFENVTGSAFNDSLTGSALANIIDGGNGDDILTGGNGADTLIGGNGNDQFKFTTFKSGADHIADFNNTSDTDLIAISKAGFGINGKVALGGSDSFDFEAHYFVSGDDAVATETGHGQFVFDSAAAKLFWDADGAGSASATLLATFQQGVTLHASDFLLA